MSRCGLCGVELKGPNLVWDDSLQNTFCRQHAPLLRSCHSCAKAASCAFEQDPSPLPKQVPIVQQQGNMTMQTIIRNPEREAITCKAGCPCYSEEWGCWRTVDPSFCLNEKYEYGGTRN